MDNNMLHVFIVLILVRRRIVIPLKMVSNGMKRFAADSSRIPDPLNIRSDDEIGEIAEAFEQMTRDISSYVNNIELLTKERLEASVQLDIARRIQNGMVPERVMLSGTGFDICGLTRPQRK